MTRSTIQDFIGSAYNYLQAKIKKETDTRELQKLRRASKYLKLALLSLNDWFNRSDCRFINADWGRTQ